VISRDLIERVTSERLSIAEVATTMWVHPGTVARWITDAAFESPQVFEGRYIKNGCLEVTVLSKRYCDCAIIC